MKHFGLIVLVLGVLIGCRPAEAPARTPIDMPANTDQVSWIRAYDDDGNRVTPFESILQMPDRQFSGMSDHVLWYYKRELTEEQLALLPHWKRERIVNANPDLDERGMPIIPNDMPMTIRNNSGHSVSVYEYLRDATPEMIIKLPQDMRNRLLDHLSAEELAQLNHVIIELLGDTQ